MQASSDELITRRIRRASLAELGVIFFIWYVFIALKYYATMREQEEIILFNTQHPQIQEKMTPDLVSGLFTSPVLIILSLFLFISILSFLLTHQTPIVSYLVRAGSAGIASRFLPFLPPIKDKDEQAYAAKTLDAVGAAFDAYISRSQLAAKTAQGRPNALLFIGGIVAFLGLIFFFLTLPGARYGFFASVDSGQAESNNHPDLWSTVIQVLPRLLMLAFIQILAGFFLRQYRAAMEDFRYYEAVLRHREAQFLAYLIRSNVDYVTPKGKGLVTFSNDLMKDREFGILRSGQTTTSLASLTAEHNEMATFYEKFADAISNMVPKSSSSAKRKADKALSAKTKPQ
jgi:hypothetical protein